MKIIITGGAGGAGQACVRDFREHGHDVCCLDLRESPAENVETRIADLMDLAATEKAIEGFDAIVHLAAIPAPRPRKDWPDVWRINTQTTYNVFEAAARKDIKKIALASSICAVGFCGGWRCDELPYLPIDEDYPNRSQEPYSASKLANEIMALSFQLSLGVQAICLRLGNIRSTKEKGLGFLACEPNFATITPEDVAQGFRLAVESEGIDYAIYNLTGLHRYTKDGQIESAEQVLEEIQTKCKNNPEIRDPEWVFSGKSSFDIRRAMNDLGFEPTT